MKQLRSEFPLAQEFAYLNTAGAGLIPRTVVGEIKEMYGRYLTTPPYEQLFSEFRQTVETARGEFAPVIGAQPDEVSFQANSSAGLNLVVQMLGLKRGDNAVADDLGFPSDVYPLLAMRKKGIDVRIVKNRDGLVTAKDYAKSIDKKTKLVMLGYVSWVNGLRLDDVREIASIARENGAYVMIDTTHATGYLDIDVRRWNVDFLTTSNYKWLLSPFGAAEFYCARRHLEEFEPPHVGWNSAEGGTRGLKVEEFKLSKSAKRFEPGNPDYVAIYGLTRSLKFLSRVGRQAIERHTLKLVREILEGFRELGMEVLSPTDEPHLSGVIFATSPSHSGAAISKSLAKRKVLVTDRYYHGVSGIRVSPYLYNDSEDVERLLEGLKLALK